MEKGIIYQYKQMKKGITITSKNINKFFALVKKEWGKPYKPDVGKCDICGKPAICWYHNKKLCYKCVVKEIKKTNDKFRR